MGIKEITEKKYGYMGAGFGVGLATATFGFKLPMFQSLLFGLGGALLVLLIFFLVEKIK